MSTAVMAAARRRVQIKILANSRHRQIRFMSCPRPCDTIRLSFVCSFAKPLFRLQFCQTIISILITTIVGSRRFLSFCCH